MNDDTLLWIYIFVGSGTSLIILTAIPYVLVSLILRIVRVGKGVNLKTLQTEGPAGITLKCWENISSDPIRRRVIRTIARYCFLVFRWLWHIYFGLRYGYSHQPLPPPDNPILLLSASSLAKKIRRGELKSEEIVQCYIDRIKSVNPILNAVVDNRFTLALEEARDVDILVKSRRKTIKQMFLETPLLGVPVTVKEGFAVKGLRHTYGSHSRRDKIADHDCVSVKLARAAGAIVLAATNCSELCSWWETYNTVYGYTKNPYHTGRIAGGSAGGECALIAAASSVMGFSSDFGGSVRIPAFCNGVYGHKLSAGINCDYGTDVPADGELAKYLCVGPICRFAADLKPFTKILAGSQAHKLRLDSKVDLAKMKVYYLEDDGAFKFTSSVHPDITEAINKVTRYLECAYQIKARKVKLSQFRYMTAVFSVKTGMGLNRMRKSLVGESSVAKSLFSALFELCKWPWGFSNNTLPGIAQTFADLFLPLPGSRIDDMTNTAVDSLKNDLVDLLSDNGVFICPTLPMPPTYHNQSVLTPFDFVYSAVFNMMQLPATHCPLGLGKCGLPIGVQLVAGPCNDNLTLTLAEELETAYEGWVCPSD